MKNDTKLILTVGVWLPVVLLAALCGLIAGAFWPRACEAYNFFDKWMNKSEVLSKEPEE